MTSLKQTFVKTQLQILTTKNVHQQSGRGGVGQRALAVLSNQTIAQKVSKHVLTQNTITTLSE